MVRVKAPLGVSKSQAYELVLSKAEWILAKLEILKQRTPPVEKRFIDGEEFVYLGQVYRLAVVIDEGVRKPVVKLDGGKLVITAPIFDPELLRTFVQKWYGELFSVTIIVRVLLAIVNIKVIHWPSKTDPLGVRTFFWT